MGIGFITCDLENLGAAQRLLCNILFILSATGEAVTMRSIAIEK